MTVIAWDGKTLAADKLCSDEWVKRYVTKIRRVRGGDGLAGASGDADHCRELLAWYENGGQFPEHLRGELRATLLVVGRDGKACLYQRGPHQITLEPGRQAIGSGGDAALAAMFCGKTSAEAVEIAALVCRGVGGGVDTLEFEPVAEPSPEPEPERGPLAQWVVSRCDDQTFRAWLASQFPDLWATWKQDAICVLSAICGPLSKLDDDEVAASRFERKIRGPYEAKYNEASKL